MHVYLDKNFLDSFNAIPLKKMNTKSNHILSNIFNSYGNTNIFLQYDINSLDDFDKLKSNNISFAQNFPISIHSIKEHFFKSNKSESILIFTKQKLDWEKEAEKKGAICFSFKNYKKKIKDILKICEGIKIDLSQTFPGWSVFNKLKNLPKNRVTISDNFLIENRTHISSNALSLIKNIITVDLEADLTIFTERTRASNGDGNTVYSNVLNSFCDYVLKIELIFRNHYPNFNFHDRILYSNLFYIEIPIGFNFKIKKGSNSIIRVETIFDKFHYDRIKNHTHHLNKVKKSYSETFPKSNT